MANRRHVSYLRAGARAWNRWRKEYPFADIDLQQAELAGTSLGNVDLTALYVLQANFSETDLANADLSHSRFRSCCMKNASFSDATLLGTVFEDVDFTYADFRRANATGARFEQCRLTGATFNDAYLISAVLTGGNLSGCQFSGTVLSGTVFSAVDLRPVVDLEHVDHAAPSPVDMGTLRASSGEIPTVFLRGCGLLDNEIRLAELWNQKLPDDKVIDLLYEVARLRTKMPIQTQPVFISYSHKDADFVDVLEKHLADAGTRFWRDVHDLIAGRMESQVDRAMRLNPVVVLVLSAHSVASDWVEWEACHARELEKSLSRDVLCPIALDDAWKDCLWPGPLRQQIAAYHVIDFKDWRNDSSFNRQFEKLWRGLQRHYSRVS